MVHALVLNASYEPLCVVSEHRAVVLLLAAKAVAVQESGAVLHSASTEVGVPSVVRLTRFVKVPYRQSVPLTRRGVLARDLHRCVYCGATATSIDHVQPRSRGGPHVWENVVAACRHCNHSKADRTLAELGWSLRHPPQAPSGVAWRILGQRTVDPRWHEYLHPGGAVADVRELELPVQRRSGKLRAA